MSDISLKVFQNCCWSRHIKRVERTRRPSSISAPTLSCWDYRGRRKRRMRQKKNTGGSGSISAYRLTGNLWKGFVLRRELICGRAAETERKEHRVRPLPVSSSRGNGVWEKHLVWSFYVENTHTTSVTGRMTTTMHFGMNTDLFRKYIKYDVTLPVPKSDTCEVARSQTA